MITFRSMTMDWTRRKMVEWSSQLMYVEALHSLTQAMAALSISCLLPPWPAKAFRKLSRNSFWPSRRTGSSVSASASKCVFLHVCVYPLHLPPCWPYCPLLCLWRWCVWSQDRGWEGLSAGAKQLPSFWRFPQSCPRGQIASPQLLNTQLKQKFAK